MKKKMIITTALTLVVLAAGAVSASAASACNNSRCGDEKALRQFTQETASLSSRLEAKYQELRQAYGNDSIDINKVNDLEAEITVIKEQIRDVADKLDVPACKLG